MVVKSEILTVFNHFTATVRLEDSSAATKTRPQACVAIIKLGLDADAETR